MSEHDAAHASVPGSWTGVGLMVLGTVLLALAAMLLQWWLAVGGGVLFVAGAVIARRSRVMSLGTPTQDITQVGPRGG